MLTALLHEGLACTAISCNLL